MASDPIFRRNAVVEMRRLSGAGILVDAEGNHFGVNQVGVRIWDLLEESGSLEALVDSLLREFDISVERCRAEAEAFVGDLLARGLAVRTERR